MADVFAAAGQGPPEHVRPGPWADDVLPQVLPALRRWYGLSQEQLGQLLEVAPGSVASWERGRHCPGARARAALDRLAARG